jgi:hypothetical protein
MPPEWTDPERLTVIGLLVIVIVSGMRRDWVWGWTYQEMRARAERFEELALKTLGLAERMTDIAERVGKDGRP